MAYISFQPSDFFSSKIYVGTGSTATVTGVGFQPDMAWIKIIESAYNATMWDSVRGANNRLFTPTNAANVVDEPDGYVSAFTADGYTVTAGSSSDDYVNNTSDDYMSWNWKAGTTTGLSGGTITPTSYSINTTSGVGIYKFTGTGSAGTIAHGLGATPTMIIVKKTNTTGDWYVYHKDMPSGNGYHLRLNATSYEASGTEWNSTDPTSTVFSLGANSNVNASAATFIAYVFAPVKGYSQFGSYTGLNNSNGPFVYTGFRPAFLMVKTANSDAQRWNIMDIKRAGFNPNGWRLFADSSSAQLTNINGADLLSNGFKMRVNDACVNSTPTYIYMAFSEFPIVSSNDVPGVAR